jgi:hypothetical protein
MKLSFDWSDIAEFYNLSQKDPRKLIAQIYPDIAPIIILYVKILPYYIVKQQLEEWQQELAIYMLDNDCKIIRAYNPDKSSPITWISLITKRKLLKLIKCQHVYFDKHYDNPFQKCINVASSESTFIDMKSTELLNCAILKLNCDDYKFINSFCDNNLRLTATCKHLAISYKIAYKRKIRILEKLRIILKDANRKIPQSFYK